MASTIFSSRRNFEIQYNLRILHPNFSCVHLCSGSAVISSWWYEIGPCYGEIPHHRLKFDDDIIRAKPMHGQTKQAGIRGQTFEAEAEDNFPSPWITYNVTKYE